MLRRLSPGKLLLAFAAVVAAAALVLFLVPDNDVYLFLPDEPRPVEPLLEIEGTRPADDSGGIYFVDVLVRRPSLLERLWPGLFHDGESVVPAHALNPTGLSEEERRESSLQVMSRSQQVAAAVALEAAGYDVDARANGAYVVQVQPGSPAAEDVRSADVIVGVDGDEVDTPERLRELLAERRPGDEVGLELRRGDRTLTVELTLGAADDDPERAVIGVFVEQNADIRLPVEIEIDAGNVGGPSAGLAFALGIYDELGRDVDDGRRIAVTGEIGLDGDVGAVGGIKQKTIGAREGGAQLFLVPAGDNAVEARRYAGDLRVVPVENFQQALQALATGVGNGQN